MRIIRIYSTKGANIMNEKIDNFLNKWNEMLDAAEKIPEFNWTFEVKISSSNEFVEDRVKTINGINSSFTKHDMGWTSTNN